MADVPAASAAWIGRRQSPCGLPSAVLPGPQAASGWCLTGTGWSAALRLVPRMDCFPGQLYKQSELVLQLAGGLAQDGVRVYSLCQG